MKRYLLCLAVLSAATPWQARAQTALLGDVTLGLRQGRPTVFRDGQPLLMPAYCDSILGWGGPGQVERWQSWVDGFVGSGVKVYHLEMGRYKGGYGQSSFWTDENVYPANAPFDEPLSTDRQALYILGKVPDARFIVRLHAYAPKPWIEKNPGEMQTDSAGKTWEPSWASTKYLDGLSNFLRRVVLHCEAQPWGNRVLGYMMMPYGEGLTSLSVEGNFYDRGAAMGQAWRAYLTEQYHTDDALRQAWGDAGATLAGAAVPTDDALRAKTERLPHWPAASDMRQERDYAALQRRLLARWLTTIVSTVKTATPNRSVLIGIDALKQPMFGWELQNFFNGKGRGHEGFSMFLSSGSVGVGPLLDNPDLKCLITPADYTARGMGFGFESEGIADSLILRGKAFFVENDARTYLHPDYPEGFTAGTFNTIEEVRAGLLRNTAMTLSRGLFHYYTDIGSGYYNDATIQREIRRDKAVQEYGQQWPHRETEHAIALIIDDESPLYENFTNGFQNIAVLRQRVEGLALAGIPYRIYLLSDLERADFPRYRCYLFPDLFKVDAHVIELLHRKVFRDGSVAIFGPGTGITDGETVTARGAEMLLQMPMKLYDVTTARRVKLRDRALPALRARNMPPLYGDSYQYGPVLLPDPARLRDAGVQTLGDAVASFTLNAPGLVMKEFGHGAAGNGRPGPRGAPAARGAGDYAAVFSAAAPLPPALLRSLARYGGCKLWCDDDVALFASDTMVALHSNEPGPFTITLPHPAAVVIDAATGKLVGRHLRQLRLRLTPPDTQIFLLK